MKNANPISLSRRKPHPNRTFELVPYDASWPEQFKTKATVLRNIFGSNALAIEHVGSTALPDMVAKPQIDILVTVKDLDKVKDYHDQMRKAGYTPRGDYTGEGEEYFTEDAKDGKRITSIHVLPEGHVWAIDLIDFRDYLRSHPKARLMYAEAKLKAAKQHKDSYDAYHKDKRIVIVKLRRRAAKWKQPSRLNKTAKES